MSPGPRWAKLAKTPVLMRLMRHENIATTMTFYVDLECDEVTEQLYGIGSIPASDRGADRRDAIR
jgi:hypothetical protein